MILAIQSLMRMKNNTLVNCISTINLKWLARVDWKEAGDVEREKQSIYFLWLIMAD